MKTIEKKKNNWKQWKMNKKKKKGNEVCEILSF